MKIKCYFKIEINYIFVKIILIMLPLIAAGAGLQGLSLINSYFDKKQAEQEAARLANTPIEQYSMSPEMLEQKRIASNMFSSPQGYTPQEAGVYDRNIRRILSGQNYNATNVGGGGAGRVISGIGNASAVNAATDFAANDASIARQNRNMGLSNLTAIANKAQSIKDMNTQMKVNRRLMQEQAVGAAIRSNKDLINSTLSGIGQDLVGAGLTKGLIPKTASVGGGVPLDINSPEMLQKGFRLGNRFSNFIDNTPMASEAPNRRGYSFQFPDTQDMTYNFKAGRYE